MDSTTFFIELLKNYGLYTTIGTIAILYVLKDIWSKKSEEIFGKKKKKINLLEHVSFKEFDYLIEHNLKESFNCPCCLRKALYKDIMVDRLSCFKMELMNFVKTDLESKTLYPTQYDFFLKVTSVLDSAARKSRQNSIINGVPKFVLDDMEEHRETLRQCLGDMLKAICYSEYNYSSNKERMSAILTYVVIFCKNYMDVLEEVLGSFNGNIKSLTYNGISCANCKVCIHTEYLDKLKKMIRNQ